MNFGFTGATGSAGNSQQVQITHLDAVTGAGTHSQYGLLSSIGDRPFVDQTASHLVTASGSAVFDTHTGITTLTSASKSQAGAVFSDGFIDLKGDFNLGFSFMAGTKDSGGEGLAFVLQNDPLGAHSRGSGGASLGAGGIANGLGIAIDTKQSAGDIKADHTNFFDTDVGTSAGRISPQVSLPNLEDGKWHTAIVSWNAQSETLSYWIDGNAGGTLTGDLANQYFGNSELVHFGFTGATSASTNLQQVKVTDFHGTLLSPVYAADGHIQFDPLAHI